MKKLRTHIVVVVVALLLQFVSYGSTGLLSPLMFVLFGRPHGPGPYWHGGPPPWHRPPRPPPWHGGEVDEVIVEHAGPARPQPTVVQVAHHPGIVRPVIGEPAVVVPVPVNTVQPGIVQPIYSNPVQPIQSVQPVQAIQPMQPMPAYTSAMQPFQQGFIPQNFQPSSIGQLGLPVAPLTQLSPQKPVIPMPHDGIQPLGPAPPPSPIYPR